MCAAATAAMPGVEKGRKKNPDSTLVRMTNGSRSGAPYDYVIKATPCDRPSATRTELSVAAAHITEFMTPL